MVGSARVQQLAFKKERKDSLPCRNQAKPSWQKTLRRKRKKKISEIIGDVSMKIGKKSNRRN